MRLKPIRERSYGIEDKEKIMKVRKIRPHIGEFFRDVGVPIGKFMCVLTLGAGIGWVARDT